jgi:hypothetical protein
MLRVVAAIENPPPACLVFRLTGPFPVFEGDGAVPFISMSGDGQDKEKGDEQKGQERVQFIRQNFPHHLSVSHKHVAPLPCEEAARFRCAVIEVNFIARLHRRFQRFPMREESTERLFGVAEIPRFDFRHCCFAVQQPPA